MPSAVEEAHKELQRIRRDLAEIDDEVESLDRNKKEGDTAPHVSDTSHDGDAIVSGAHEELLRIRRELAEIEDDGPQSLTSSQQQPAVNRNRSNPSTGTKTRHISEACTNDAHDRVAELVAELSSQQEDRHSEGGRSRSPARSVLEAPSSRSSLEQDSYSYERYGLETTLPQEVP